MESERKHTTRFTKIIFWIIGAVAITGAVFMLLPKEDNNIKLRGIIKLSGDAMDIVNSYLQWAERASKEDMDLNHGFAASGLSKMAGALQVISERVSKTVGKESKVRIDTIKEMSKLLVQDSRSLEHADMIKKAFTASEKVLTSVQTNSFPELKDEIETLNQKISAIEPDKPMLEQKAEIIENFQHVALILTRMTDNKNKKLE